MSKKITIGFLAIGVITTGLTASNLNEKIIKQIIQKSTKIKKIQIPHQKITDVINIKTVEGVSSLSKTGSNHIEKKNKYNNISMYSDVGDDEILYSN